MSTDFYGRGIAHPFGTGPAGGVREAAELAKIEQSIRVILGTQHGERLMRPTFGANLRRLAFAPNNLATANLAKRLVSSALDAWEPRIEVTGVDVAHNHAQAALSITVQYRIKGSQETRDLTLPVPLEQP